MEYLCGGVSRFVGGESGDMEIWLGKGRCYPLVRATGSPGHLGAN